MNNFEKPKETVAGLSNRRNGKIDLLRFVFSVCIALMHFGTSVGDARLFPKAGLCVEFFFLVSGYLMAKHVAKIMDQPCERLGSESFSYVRKKFFSICPQIIIAFVIGFTVRHLISAVSPATFEKHILAGFVEFLNLKMFGFDLWSANGPTWYISAMLIIMLLIYPLLRKRFDLFCYVIAPLTGFFLLGFLK